MIRLLWNASLHIRAFLRTWMPSNIVLDLVRRRQNLRWGIPAMLLAAPYFAVAYWCRGMIEAGGPGWLNLVVLLCIWSALKFIIMGPVSVVLLAKARIREKREQRTAVNA
ncbi:MAG TPA: sulfate permease [Microbacterium sp.]|nr:sulfate permease [Microbacterium sp.]